MNELRLISGPLFSRGKKVTVNGVVECDKLVLIQSVFVWTVSAERLSECARDVCQSR